MRPMIDEEVEAICRMEPSATLSTGFDGCDGAPELEIFRLPEVTVVIPCGEVQNDVGWAYDGHPLAREIVRDYRRKVKRENEWWDHKAIPAMLGKLTKL